MRVAVTGGTGYTGSRLVERLRARGHDVTALARATAPRPVADPAVTWVEGLPEERVSDLLREGLELVATRTRYSLRELVGTIIALRQEKRGEENVMSRDCSMYCSAFVQHLFRKAGLDLAPGVQVKNTTPDDISRTSVPHVTYVLKRGLVRTKLEHLRVRLRRRVRARIKSLKKPE